MCKEDGGAGCNDTAWSARGRPQFPAAAEVAAGMALDLALDTAAAKVRAATRTSPTAPRCGGYGLWR